MPQQVCYRDTQGDILQLLDKVLSTGLPVEIERKGQRLVISPAEKRRELNCLENHSDFVVGNSDDLVHIDWSSDWNPEV